MLTREFHRAERLAKEHDADALEALRRTCAKRQTYAAYVGLFALLYLFGGDWAAIKIAADFHAAHAETFRLAYLLVGGGGLGLYFALSKRYSDKGQLAELALELKRRDAASSAARKEE
jgi:hypothetical protein